MEKDIRMDSNVEHAVSVKTEKLVDRKQAVAQEEHKKGTFLFRERFWQWTPFLGIVLLGAILRFVGLDDKPLHHDESLHAYFSLQLMHNMEQWHDCFTNKIACYHYDPLLHGPFQFHIIALVYKISQILGAPDHGINTTTVRIAAATLGSLLVGLPYFLRDYLGGRRNAWIACFLLAVSPSMVYFSRFAREDIYMAFFTLLLVVSAGRYVRDRKMRWLVLAALGFTLSYATKEATFLSIAVFGSFSVAVMVWELGSKIQVYSNTTFARYLPKTCAPAGLIILYLICAPLAKWFFGWMKDTSVYISTYTDVTDKFVQNLKVQTMAVLPWLGAAIVLCVVVLCVRDLRRKPDQPGTHVKENTSITTTTPLLQAVVEMPWTHWAFALVAGSFVFVLLFSTLFTNLQHGIADGIWQGLYYWLQQQQVARGGQPWYYYLLLIPLYEQIGLVFGLIGVVRSILHPTRFRLFLLYWFLGNVAIYSWAAEKMPWLMIHLTMPMMLLATIGLEPLLNGLLSLVKDSRQSTRGGRKVVRLAHKKPSSVIIVCGMLCTIFLLVLTLQNMFQVTYVHYADGPHEMMIYVQTDLNVNTVMNKIDELDQKWDGGQHELAIGVMEDAEWPFYWYLRDYTNVCYGFPTGCSDANPAVIISGGDNLNKSQSQYASSNATGRSSNYLFHQYHLRNWWDEGYKPPPCVPSLANNNCQGQPTWGGVGPLLWLSYGDKSPAGAQFNPGLALKNIWEWWWQRKPFGSTAGATDMGLFIRSDLGVNP